MKAALLSLLLVFSGCFADEPASSATDLSRHLDASADAIDAAPSPADMDFPSKTTKLSSEPTISVNGVTADHFVLAYEPLGASATSLVDGVRKFNPMARAVPVISHRTAFGWSDFSGLSQEIEIRAPGAGTIATAPTSVPETATADPTGAYVFFTTDVAWDQTALNLVLAKGDGTDRSVIADASILSDDCLPSAQFAGDSLIALHCPADGTGAHELLVADVKSGMQMSLRRGLRAQPFWVDSVKRAAFVADASRTGWVVPVDGSQPSFVDDDVADGLILPGGTVVVYRTSAGVLKRKSIGMAVPPLVLVAQGVSRLIIRTPNASRTSEAYLGPVPEFSPAVSPDGSWIVYSGERDPLAVLSNLYLASTAIPGTPTTLVDSGRGRVQGDVFTQDSAHVLFFDDCYLAHSSHVSGYVGKLHSHDILAGTTRELSTGSYFVHAGRGGQIVFGDNYSPAGGYRGTQDMWWIDLATPDAVAQPIIQRVNVDWSFDKALNRAVFGVWTDRGREGMYTFELP